MDVSFLNHAGYSDGMATLTPRTLVYDGDCSMCRKLSALAERRWLVGDARRLPHDAFEGETAERLTEAGIHNELAVIDDESGEIRSGYDGILWLLERGMLGWLFPLLRFGPVRWLLRHDYRLVAYNRRILAPPRRGVTCACDPDLHVGYRWAFIVVALLWTALFAGLGGALFWTELPFWPDFPLREGAPTGTWLAGPIVLAGWLAAAAAAFLLPAERRLDHLGHMAWTFAAMALPLVLASFLALGGLLLEFIGVLPFVPDVWYLEQGWPCWFGAIAWALALPIACISGLWRLPRLGFRKHTALLLALVSWFLPSAFLFWLLPTPFHVT